MYATKVRTTEEAINAATDRLASDITTLAGKRDVVLSAFRQRLQTWIISIVD